MISTLCAIRLNYSAILARTALVDHGRVCEQGFAGCCEAAIQEGQYGQCDGCRYSSLDKAH